MAAASQQWERSAASASGSHRELMERLRQSADDLTAATGQLRAAEAGRLAAAREAGAERERADAAEGELLALRGALEQR
jgi:hypothetical protein